MIYYRLKDDIKYGMNLITKQSKIYNKIKIIAPIKNKDLVNIEHNFLNSYKERLERVKFNILFLKQKIEKNYLNQKNNDINILQEIDSLDRLICQLIIEKQVAKYISSSIFKVQKFTDFRYEFGKAYLKIRKLYSEIMNLRNHLILKINDKLIKD